MLDNRILDSYKRHIKDRENEDISLFLGSNDKLSFIVKKTKRIVAAIYLLTDFFDDREPIRWSLRESSLELLYVIVSNRKREGGRKGGSSAFLEYSETIARVVYLLEISLYAQFLSPMNFSILREELTGLRNTFEAFLSDDSVNDFEFPPYFFDTKTKTGLETDRMSRNNNQESKIKMDEEVGDTNKGHIKDIQKDTPYIKKYVEKERYVGDSDSRIQRRDIIMRLLRTRGELSIKDITAVMIGYSEKTLQREISFLVEKGVVGRLGARRWSTYRLISENKTPKTAPQNNDM